MFSSWVLFLHCFLSILKKFVPTSVVALPLHITGNTRQHTIDACQCTSSCCQPPARGFFDIHLLISASWGTSPYVTLVRTKSLLHFPSPIFLYFLVALDYLTNRNGLPIDTLSMRALSQSLGSATVSCRSFVLARTRQRYSSPSDRGPTRLYPIAVYHVNLGVHVIRVFSSLVTNAGMNMNSFNVLHMSQGCGLRTRGPVGPG